MVRTIVMNEWMTAINRRKRQTSPECFVEPASAEIFLMQWKILQKKTEVEFVFPLFR